MRPDARIASTGRFSSCAGWASPERTSSLSVKRQTLYAKPILERQGLVYPWLSQPEGSGEPALAHAFISEGLPLPHRRAICWIVMKADWAASGMPLSGGWIASVHTSLSGDTPFLARSHRHKTQRKSGRIWRCGLGAAGQPDLYHLSTVIDDADSAITLVVRGADLAPVTQSNACCKRYWACPPVYWHHPLVTDEAGQRLAKRHDALALKPYARCKNSPLIC